MGPSVDYLPRPVELDPSYNRSLPPPGQNPPWESSLFQNSAYGGSGSSNIPGGNPAKTSVPADLGHREGAPDPIVNWYYANDGPYIPRGTIPDAPPDPKNTARGPPALASHFVPVPWKLGPYGNRYRGSRSSENGTGSSTLSAPYTLSPPSDSGYGSRRSLENTSIFSSDVGSRGPDSHSFPGTPSDPQRLYQENQDLAPTRGFLSETWSNQSSGITLVEESRYQCSTCHRYVKTRSELK